MENKLIAIDKSQIEELIDTLKFLQLKVLSTLKNDQDGGLVKELKDINDEIANLTDTVSTLDDLCLKSEVILKNFTNFEVNYKKILDEQILKAENLKDTLELRATIWTEQLGENLNTLKSELEKEISKKLKDVDLKRFENANQNVKDAIKNFDVFHQKMEKSYLKNNILTGIISFLGGGTVIGSLVYFFLK